MDINLLSQDLNIISSAAGNIGYEEEISPTLSTVKSPAVYDARGNGGGEIAPTITGGHEGSISDYTAILQSESSVRRLTPLECERLQGYPDYWTDIGDWG